MGRGVLSLSRDNNMSELGDIFTKECQKLKVEPSEYILDQLKYVNFGKESTTFCLSSRNVSPFACEALTKVFQSEAANAHFFELDVSDSILSQEALKTLFRGLTLAGNVRILNLKGRDGQWGPGMVPPTDPLS